MKQQGNKGAMYFSQQEAINKVREIRQMRRAKLYASYLLESIDNKSELTPALHELLKVKAGFSLQTTSTKVLAAYLQRSPAIIRAEFQRILTLLGDHGRYSSFCATERCCEFANKN